MALSLHVSDVLIGYQVHYTFCYKTVYCSYASKSNNTNKQIEDLALLPIKYHVRGGGEWAISRLCSSGEWFKKVLLIPKNSAFCINI